MSKKSKKESKKSSKKDNKGEQSVDQSIMKPQMMQLFALIQTQQANQMVQRNIHKQPYNPQKGGEFKLDVIETISYMIFRLFPLIPQSIHTLTNIKLYINDNNLIQINHIYQKAYKDLLDVCIKKELKKIKFRLEQLINDIKTYKNKIKIFNIQKIKEQHVNSYLIDQNKYQKIFGGVCEQDFQMCDQDDLIIEQLKQL